MITVLRVKLVWICVLILAFVGFCVWYGGAGKPVSQAEGERLLERLATAYPAAAASGRGFIANMREMIPNDDGREFYAVNLETLKDGSEAQAADQTYAGIVVPLLFKRASHPVFVSERAGLMLGEYGETVDRVAVVRYRSLRDLITMTLEPAMQDGEHYKFAALDHTEVFITRPIISFLQIRLLLALVLLCLGWLGLRTIDWVGNRRATQG